jgi:hypothetical protein
MTRGFGSSATLPQLFRILLAETQNGRQSFVDTPLLVWSDPPDQVAKPTGVDGADLLDEDAASLAQQFYLGAERRGPGTERHRGARTTERGSNSSACTITPYRRPRCS